MPREASVKGIHCPTCGEAALHLVVNSRRIAGLVYRRRQCAACQARFSTYEAVIDPRVFTTQRDRAKLIATQLRQMAVALDVW